MTSDDEGLTSCRTLPRLTMERIPNNKIGKFNKIKGGHIPQPPKLSGSTTARSKMSSVHTLGGITNSDNTLYHTPGPGYYDVKYVQKGLFSGRMLQEKRKIESFCGAIDLFSSWNGVVCSKLVVLIVFLC